MIKLSTLSRLLQYYMQRENRRVNQKRRKNKIGGNLSRQRYSDPECLRCIISYLLWTATIHNNYARRCANNDNMCGVKEQLYDGSQELRHSTFNTTMQEANRNYYRLLPPLRRFIWSDSEIKTKIIDSLSLSVPPECTMYVFVRAEHRMTWTMTSAWTRPFVSLFLFLGVGDHVTNTYISVIQSLRDTRHIQLLCCGCHCICISGIFLFLLHSQYTYTYTLCSFVLYPCSVQLFRVAQMMYVVRWSLRFYFSSTLNHNIIVYFFCFFVIVLGSFSVLCWAAQKINIPQICIHGRRKMTSTVASGSSGITQNSGQFICIVTIIIIK